MVDLSSIMEGLGMGNVRCDVATRIHSVLFLHVLNRMQAGEEDSKSTEIV
jgi:hypothetical protein